MQCNATQWECSHCTQATLRARVQCTTASGLIHTGRAMQSKWDLLWWMGVSTCTARKQHQRICGRIWVIASSVDCASGYSYSMYHHHLKQVTRGSDHHVQTTCKPRDKHAATAKADVVSMDTTAVNKCYVRNSHRKQWSCVPPQTQLIMLRKRCTVEFVMVQEASR